MTLVINDRVRETTTVEGTGAALLLGAAQGFQSFAVVGNANTTYYCISDQAGAKWEVGIGTYTSANTTLARTTVLASSNAGALVSFTAGTKDVFVTYPSEKGVWLDASNNAIGLGTPAAFVGTNITGTASGLTAGNVTTNANLTGAITSSGNATSLGSFTSLQLATALTNETGTGSAVFSDNASLLNPTYTGTLTGSTGVLNIGSGQVYKDASGNVGIGTTSPSSRLDITWTANAGIRLSDGTVTGVIYNTGGNSMGIGAITNHPMVLYTNNTERMRIDSSGNVGIGTSSPSGKLDVSTGINLGLSYLNVAYDIGGGVGWLGGYNVTYSAGVKNVATGALSAASYQSGGVVFYTNTSSAAGTVASERMRIDSTGIALIGTSAASGTNKLQVSTDALINGVTVGLGGGNNANNIAIGNSALASNTGIYNIGIGLGALATTTANNNVGIGLSALAINTSGTQNVGVGRDALIVNVLGNGNTCLGFRTLLTATTAVATLGAITGGTGYTNGSYTGVALTYVSGATASAYPTVNITVAGGIVTACTLVTFGSGFKGITTVMSCASIGAGTGFAISPATLSSASNNVAIGLTAGYGITTGSNNVVIGGYAGITAPISATGSNYVVLSDGAGNIRTYYDSNGNQVNYGVNATSAAAPTIASATTIAPTKAITFISGVTPVVTITAPSPISLGGGTITLIPTGIFTTTIAGNIALASTAVVGRALTMTYDVTTTKWYPSY